MQPYHLDAENLSLSILSPFFLFFVVFLEKKKKDPSFHLTFICSTLLTLLETIMRHLAKHQMTCVCGGGPVVLPLHNKTFPPPVTSQISTAKKNGL